ncbi:MAG: hypothetical protein K2G44_01905 [Clostridia bacterium]|nr:hypothetical protein [Clostridia bacterium]
MVDNSYIEIYFRIAVILNESGLLRNNYSNIIPNLDMLMNSANDAGSKIRKRYLFTGFTRSNLSDMFNVENDNYINNFDALFISTNATNDNEVKSKLTANTEVLAEFLNSGRGLFIGSQKKLSDKPDTISFLPDTISYSYVKRPEIKSSEGEISIVNEKSPIVAGCDGNEITNKCHNNKFKDHVYRSWLQLNYSELFEPILVDKKENSRVLLVRAKNQKIVYTTISADYEEQNELLHNIIIYITEGISSIGFFGNVNNMHFEASKFSDLFLSAKINKMTFDIYGSLDITPDVLSKKIYVISPEFDFEEVKEFWRGLLSKSKDLKKILYIHDSNKCDNAITEYRNYSNTDLRLQQVIQWVEKTLDKKTRDKEEKSRREEEEKKKRESVSATDAAREHGSKKAPRTVVHWGADFWTTYDTMTFFYELSQTYGEQYADIIASYAPSVLDSWESHYRLPDKNDSASSDNDEIGSYDGMLNCSCAMLEMFYLFHLDELKANGKFKGRSFQKYRTESTLEYIKQCLNKVAGASYLLDMESSIISFYNLKRIAGDDPIVKTLFEPEKDGTSYVQKLLKKVVKDRILEKFKGVIHKPANSGQVSKYYAHQTDTQELCKDIEIIGLALSDEDNIFESDEQLDAIKRCLFHHIVQLKSKQVNGCWINLNRTAAIFKSLIRAKYLYDDIETECSFELNSVLSQLIGVTLNYINKTVSGQDKKFDRSSAWMSDLMATVTTAYSLCVYNRSNKSLAYEIEHSILNSVDSIIGAASVEMAAIEMTRMRNRITDILQEKSACERELETLKSNYKKEEADNKYRHLKLRNTMVLAIVFLFVIAVEQFIVIAQYGMFNKFLTWLFSLLGTIVAFGVSILLKNLIEKKMFMTDDDLKEASMKKQARKEKKQEKKRKKAEKSE